MAKLTKGEAESYIENLKTFPVEEVGSHQWIDQVICIERLNVSAHLEASGNQFEQVVDSIKTLDKFEVLVHELIIGDEFQRLALPKIKEKSPQQAFARIYMTEHAIIALLNLLELVVYKPEDLSADGLLPLVDFCNRHIAVLTTTDISVIDLQQPDPKQMEILSVGFSCLSIIWCLLACEPTQLSVVKRLVADVDVGPTIAELIVKQPWRTVKKGKVIKWFNGELKTLSAGESQRICPPEAHAWTSLQQLMNPRCLEQTRWNEARKAAFLEVDEMLSEVLIDQIPPLEALKRSLQWLKVNEIPPPKFVPIIEQINPIEQELEKKVDWPKLIENSLKKYYNAPPQVMQAELMKIAEFFEIFGETGA